MTRHNRTYLYLSLTAAAIASWWLAAVTEVDEAPAGLASDSPDFFSVDYRKWEMDADGALKSLLVARKVQHYGAEGGTHLQQPRLTLNKGPSSAWVVDAERGWLHDDGQQLQLKGQVAIERQSPAPAKAIKITTSELYVRPADNQAETQASTTIINPPSVTTGVGMRLTFAEPIKMRLLSNVQGRYE